MHFGYASLLSERLCCAAAGVLPIHCAPAADRQPPAHTARAAPAAICGVQDPLALQVINITVEISPSKLLEYGVC